MSTRHGVVAAATGADRLILDPSDLARLPPRVTLEPLGGTLV